MITQQFFDTLDQKYQQALSVYFRGRPTSAWVPNIYILVEDEAGQPQPHVYELFGQNDNALRRRLAHLADLVRAEKVVSVSTVRIVWSTRLPKEAFGSIEQALASPSNAANRREELQLASQAMEGYRSDWHAPILRSLTGNIALGEWYATEPYTQHALDYFYAEYLRRNSPLAAMPATPDPNG